MENLKDLRIKHQERISSLVLDLEKLKKILEVDNFIFDEKEVEQVCNFYKFNFKNPEKLGLSLSQLKSLFFAYCSKAFISSNGGELILDINKRSINYGETIIIKYGVENYPWVAISIDAWIERIETGRLSKKLSETILRNLKDKSE